MQIYFRMVSILCLYIAVFLYLRGSMLLWYYVPMMYIEYDDGTLYGYMPICLCGDVIVCPYIYEAETIILNMTICLDVYAIMMVWSNAIMSRCRCTAILFVICMGMSI